MNLEMNDRVVLITGGSDGLGAALAEKIVDEGGRVAVCARGEAKLTAFATRLSDRAGDPQRVLAVRADVASADDIARFVKEVIDRWGRIDGLVNNAGTHSSAPFELLADTDWRSDLDGKLMAAARSIRAVLPHMRVHGGAIVNVVNHFAKAPEAGSMPTSVSRAASMAMTKALSRELGGSRVRVNAIVVGLVETGQGHRKAAQLGVTPAAFYAERVRSRGVPMQRAATAAEFADLGAFLLSPRSSYITGAAINFDGGLCAVT